MRERKQAMNRHGSITAEEAVRMTTAAAATSAGVVAGLLTGLGCCWVQRDVDRSQPVRLLFGQLMASGEGSENKLTMAMRLYGRAICLYLRYNIRSRIDRSEVEAPLA